MTLESLYTVYEICQDMNLSETSKRLYVSQQALSGHIKRLEEYYKTVMFERRPNLVLTKEGEMILGAIEHMLEVDRVIKTELNKSVRSTVGELRLSVGMAWSRVLIGKLLEEFYLMYPGVKVQTSLLGSLQKDEFLSHRGVDLMIGHELDNPPDFVEQDFLTNVNAAIVISKSYLQQLYPDKWKEFIKDHKYGVGVLEFPSDTILITTGAPKDKFWLESFEPKIRTRRLVFLPSTDDQAFMSYCESENGLIIVSENYINFLFERFPEFKDKMICFSHLAKDERASWKAMMIYDKTKSHPSYFYDFLDLAKKIAGQ